jgi:hypothetical protein
MMARVSPPPSIPLLTCILPRPALNLPAPTDLEYCSIRLQKSEAVHAFAMRAMAGHTKDAAQ